MALEAIGPPAKEALPALSRTLKDPDERLRKYAARAISSIRGEPR
jgi:HEAT repeat protein